MMDVEEAYDIQRFIAGKKYGVDKGFVVWEDPEKEKADQPKCGNR